MKEICPWIFYHFKMRESRNLQIHFFRITSVSSGEKLFPFTKENLPDIRGTVHRKISISCISIHMYVRNRVIWFRGVSDSAGYDPAGSLVQPLFLRPRWISRKASGACHCLSCINCTNHDIYDECLSSTANQFFLGVVQGLWMLSGRGD